MAAVYRIAPSWLLPKKSCMAPVAEGPPGTIRDVIRPLCELSVVPWTPLAMTSCGLGMHPLQRHAGWLGWTGSIESSRFYIQNVGRSKRSPAIVRNLSVTAPSWKSEK
jgi:hypothetical protein